MQPVKPRVFIGSSAKALSIAQAVQANLDSQTYPEVWNQGVLPLTRSIFDSLLATARVHDFAVFVFLPEDIVSIRGETKAVVRDNVVLEFGLFLGALGPDRTFALMPQADPNLQLPSDLAGVLIGAYDPHHPNLQAALGPVCNAILKRMSMLPFQPRASTAAFANLSEAAGAIMQSIAASATRQVSVIASTAAAAIPSVFEHSLPPGTVRLGIQIVNPDHPLASALPGHWPEDARRSLKRLHALARDYGDRVKIECWVYDHIPCVHGFLIDDDHLFIGYYRWEMHGAARQLVGAQAPYHYYQRHSSTEEYFILFKSWWDAPTVRRYDLSGVS
jgi:Predicted nucleotide-binding protein containing TIR-like domain